MATPTRNTGHGTATAPTGCVSVGGGVPTPAPATDHGWRTVLTFAAAHQHAAPFWVPQDLFLPVPTTKPDPIMRHIIETTLSAGARLTNCGKALLADKPTPHQYDRRPRDKPSNPRPEGPTDND